MASAARLLLLLTVITTRLLLVPIRGVGQGPRTPSLLLLRPDAAAAGPRARRYHLPLLLLRARARPR